MRAKSMLTISLWCLLFVLPIAVCPAANGKIIYVDDDAIGANDGSSWPDAYNYLKDALAYANSADKPIEIRVAGGIYRPGDDTLNPNGTNNRLDTFQLINGVSLKGGFAGLGEPDPNARDIHLYETVLSGDLAGDDISWDELMEIRAQHNYSFNEPNRQDNTYHVVIGSGSDETAIIDGFTILGGCDYFDGRGGGMYIDAGSSTITNCTFTRNSAYDYGGGLYCGNNSNPILTNCIFSRNWSLYSGGMYNSHSNPLLTNCTFTENFAEIPPGIIIERGYLGCGGMRNSLSNPTLINCSFIENLDVGMYNYNSNPTLIDCSFIENMGYSGGGMYNYSNSSPILTNCVFRINQAETGAGILGGNPTLINCTFTGNEGGGISGGYPTLINCTLTGNRSDRAGGISGGSPTLVNCIVWGNTTPEIRSNAIISFSILPGNYPGEGNINTDPLFVDADGEDDIFGTEDDDLRLLEGSPGIDAGNNSAVPPSVVTEINGNPRIINDIIDIGAYENPLNDLLLSTSTLIVPESDTATFTLALAAPPLETIMTTVSFHSGDHDITVESGAILTFDSSNYSIPQTVTLSADEDSDNQNHTAQILITTDNSLTAIVTATEADNEPNVGVLFVDDDATGNNNGANWADAYINLRDALSAAMASRGIEEIRVAQGIYRPDQGGGNATGDRTATFQLINGVTIKGGFAGTNEMTPNIRDMEIYETILSGDLNSDDIEVADPCALWEEPTRTENVYHVVTCIGIDETTLFDGFTITGGNANKFPSSGGGIIISYGSPRITDCTFSYNSAYDGGGMDIYSSNPVLTNCIFTSNYAEDTGGGIDNSDCSPTLINCTFENNFAYYYGGGGMDNFLNHPTLIDCAFFWNTADGYFAEGGAMRNYASNPVLTNCIFKGNSVTDGYSAQGGAIYNVSDVYFVSSTPHFNGSNPVISNCIFIGNVARQGAGICNVRNCNPFLTNCTFSGNSAQNGAVLYNLSSSPVLTNCILWNGSNEIWNNYASTATITYSTIQGGWEGEGNIDFDPLFADSDNGDYYLKSQTGRWDPVIESWIIDDVTSPCIDAGDPNSPIGYEPFPNGGIINMGAYGGTPEASKSL